MSLLTRELVHLRQQPNWAGVYPLLLCFISRCRNAKFISLHFALLSRYINAPPALHPSQFGKYPCMDMDHPVFILCCLFFTRRLFFHVFTSADTQSSTAIPESGNTLSTAVSIPPFAWSKVIPYPSSSTGYHSARRRLGDATELTRNCFQGCRTERTVLW